MILPQGSCSGHVPLIKHSCEREIVEHTPWPILTDPRQNIIHLLLHISAGILQLWCMQDDDFTPDTEIFDLQF